MTKFRSSWFLSLLAALLLSGVPQSSLSPLVRASEACAVENHVAQYQPTRKKGALGRMFDWGLAKLENDGVLVSELVTAFLVRCERIVSMMIRSFADMALSYGELHEKELERLEQFDKEFRDLAKLRHKIDRRCLYSGRQEERSLCIEKGVEVNDKIRELRSQRSASADAIERYRGMLVWCASYKNWFC